uniref:Uncharacterized protein n=1 Tax=Arundo donax TaxID=35708 RepID=A0A0A8Z9E0_ARUDO
MGVAVLQEPTNAVHPRPAATGRQDHRLHLPRFGRVLLHDLLRAAGLLRQPLHGFRGVGTGAGWRPG